MLSIPTQTPEFVCFDFDGVLAASKSTLLKRPDLRNEEYAALLDEHIPFPNSEIFAFANLLKQAGSTLLVLSGTSYHNYATTTRRWLPEHDPTKIFERALCERSKYSPSDFQYIGESLFKVEDPKSLLMIDDSKRVIEAADAAGWQTIHYLI